MSDKQINKQPALAVIIPAYNGEKYIEQAIYSVLNQPCKDLIIIVVNDGSKDNTQRIVEKITSKDNRVILLNQTNKGVSAARNKALDYCSSDINPKYSIFRFRRCVGKGFLYRGYKAVFIG